MNSIIISGNMVRDPELRYSQSGLGITKFTIAVNHGWGEKKETFFINCTAFGKLSESVANYTAKGKKVLVKGYLQVKPHEGQDGVKKYYTDIICDEVEFLSPRDAGQAADNETPELPPDEDLPF